jgi:hypothetical protein
MVVMLGLGVSLGLASSLSMIDIYWLHTRLRVSHLTCKCRIGRGPTRAGTITRKVNPQSSAVIKQKSSYTYFLGYPYISYIPLLSLPTFPNGFPTFPYPALSTSLGACRAAWGLRTRVHGSITARPTGPYAHQPTSGAKSK